MPPKKKKTQLKKVERGYATTSIPKKVVLPSPSEASDLQAPEEEEDKAALVQTGSSNAQGKQSSNIATGADEWSEQDQFLQGLVTRLQEKVENDIIRTLKSIDYDRNVAKDLPTIELEETLREQVIKLVAESERGDYNLKSDFTSNRATSTRASDKSLVDLGQTYGVLRRLGFSQDLAFEAIKAVPRVDLNETLDWLSIHHNASEPDDAFLGSVTNDFMSQLNSQSTSGAATPVNTGEDILPAFHLATMPSSDIKSKHIANDTLLDSFPDVEDDPDAAYVQMKLQLLELTGNGLPRSPHVTDAPLVDLLKSRIEEVKRDSLFDSRNADAEFERQRQIWEQARLLTILSGETRPLPSLSSEVKGPSPSQQPALVKDVNNDFFDSVKADSDSGSEVGLLEILEPLPTEVPASEGTSRTIVIRDMPIPKTWTGPMPKRLLHDVVSQRDRHANVQYKDISGGTRYKRVSLSIRWSGKRQSDWSMDENACHDIHQAESYIATLAAHALTHLSALDFRFSRPSTKAQAAYKSLPPAYVEFWCELEKKRKDDEDQRNREVWARLVEKAESALGFEDKDSQKAMLSKPQIEMKTGSVRGQQLWNLTGRLKADFAELYQATAAYQTMLAQRNNLPIASFRQTIMDMLEFSQVIVLCGETGCGKSTQLPSFILEDQLSRGIPCNVLVTEPRRISAVSLAHRVSQELGEASGTVGSNTSLVGYSIRLESFTSKNTRLTFVTNGIALRMLESQGNGIGKEASAFDDITHIVIDEVHERSIESDFLLIVLKSLIDRRRNLKVVLMSATVDSEKISKYFGGCPVVTVPGRTFPVDARYIEDAVEYTHYSASGPQHSGRNGSRVIEHGQEVDEDFIADECNRSVERTSSKMYSPSTMAALNLLDERLMPYDLIIRLLEVVSFEDQSMRDLSQAFLIFMPGIAEIRRLNDMLLGHPRFGAIDEFIVFPLHSTISSEGQSAIFNVSPEGTRKIVIATNIAETGITIPDITCVIDSGKHKEMRFDEKRQISRLIETFIAKSNAAQRRGRAGRVRPGVCFHLFTRARFERMADHPTPEMLRLGLSDLALRIKVMQVEIAPTISEVLARALDPPTQINVQRAVAALVEVKALTSTEVLTPMGRLLSKLPTDVHLGKFLLLAALFKCLDPALTIAASLNSKGPFVAQFGMETEAERTWGKFKTGDSDFLSMHNVFASWRRASANPGFGPKFCRSNYLNQQNLIQIEELRQQYLGYLIDASFVAVDGAFIKDLNRARYSRSRNTRFVTIPTEFDRNSGFDDGNFTILNAALCASLYPKFLTAEKRSFKGGNTMRTLSNNQPVSIHPTSINFGRKPNVLGTIGTNYLMFFALVQTRKVPLASEIAPVDDLAVVMLCGDADFKLASSTIVIDNKMKYKMAPKSLVALKHLRAHLQTNLSLQFRGRKLNEKQIVWNEMAISLLGGLKGKGTRISTNLS